MPVTLSIRDVPDDIAERLRARAKRNHRSLQGELMAMLEQGVDRPGLREEAREYLAPKAEHLRLTFEEIVERAKKRGPLRTEEERASESVAEMIRRMRDERTEHIQQVLEKARRK